MKYLPEFGWNALVVTPKLANRVPAPSIIETCDRDQLTELKMRLGLRNDFSLYRQLHVSLDAPAGKTQLSSKIIERTKKLLGGYPDRFSGWRPFAVEAGGNAIRRNRVDAILSTALPLTAHAIAAEVNREKPLPWIADYRDLWNVDSDTLEPRTGPLGMILRRYERKLLSRASAITCVSPQLKEVLVQSGRPVHCIENGFDEDMFLDPQPAPDTLFTVVHTGQLYAGRRDPSPLVEAVASLIAEGKIDSTKIRVKFYGPLPNFLLSMVSELGLTRVVEICGVRPRAECIEAQRKAQLLLLLTWSTDKSAAVVTGKIFEYLGSRRPILMVGGTGSGAAASILKETGAGTYARDKSDTMASILAAYRQFCSTGEVLYDGREEAVLKYTQRRMAKCFADLLNDQTRSFNK
ncbi:MAG TPA: glycosyltransferase [Terracidiphilus sp.]